MTDLWMPEELAAPVYPDMTPEQIAERAEATSDWLDAALASTAQDWSGVVRIPAGFVTVGNVNHMRAALIARPIQLLGRGIVGANRHTTVQSQIRAAAPMASMVAGANAFELSGLILDCDGKADRGLDATGAHDAVISRVRVTDAIGWGAHIKDSHSRVHALSAVSCGSGIRLIGCTGMSVHDSIANSCTGVGLEIAGNASGLTQYSGAVSWYGGAIDACGTDGTSAQVVINGVGGGCMRDTYIESAQVGGPDGIHVRSGAHSFVGDNLHFVVSGVAVDVMNGRSLRFRDCTSPGANNRARIRRDAEAGYDVEFLGCRRDSYNDPAPWTIEHTLGVDTVVQWSCESWSDGDHAAAPPPGTLRFRTGKRVHHRSGPSFWVCTGYVGGFQWAAS